MAAIKLRLVKEGEAHINFHVNLDKRGKTGYETSVSLYNKDGQRWTAEIKFGDMPSQETPEETVDRMGLYLREMAKAMRGKNINKIPKDKIIKLIIRCKHIVLC